jgi:hypothetical protein
MKPNKRIILVHGLASKPPEEDLHRLWSDCIVNSIKVDDPALAKELRADADRVLRSGYWANEIPHHIEDDRSYVKKLETQVKLTCSERARKKDGFHVGLGDRFTAFFKSKGLDVINVLSSALTIKDNVAEHYLREIELYSHDQYIADRVRKPLEDALRDAWQAGDDVAILSHSMGTFITYDVLWRFSHRNTPEFRKWRRKQVQMLVTMGSPLGDPLVQDMLFARHFKDTGKRAYPTNVQRWLNFSALGDVVAHDSTLEDDFMKPMTDLNMLSASPRQRFRDYTKLYNPFVVVPHTGNKGSEKRNPHKSYGYLVQPKLSQWLGRFLRGELR